MSQPSLLDVDPYARHAEDFYSTPEFQTRALLRRLPSLQGMSVIEPCCGDGAIVNEIGPDCLTNDIIVRPPVVPAFTLDARKAETWRAFRRYLESLYGKPRIDVVITNPPFNDAYDIAREAWQWTPCLILLLRLSWLEPTDERGDWLAENPPTRTIVLPRYSYRRNGHGDSVTSAWCIWDKYGEFVKPGHGFVTRRECNELGATYRLAA